MRITILNQHTNNFGDEAAGISLIDTLNEKFNNPEINLIYNGDGKISCNYKNVIHRLDYKLKYMGYFNILIKMFFRNYKGNNTMKKYDDLIKQSDYVIVAPCGANIGIYKDWRFLIRILFAVYNGKKPIFYLNTIGKSGNLIFDKIAKYVLKNSKVYVREIKSKEYLDSINVRCSLGVDTAFLLKYKHKKEFEKNRIAFILTDFSNHKNFKEINCYNFINEKILPDLCIFAKNKKLSISIIPHLNTVEELKFIKSIVDIMKKKYNFNNVKIEKVKTVYDYYDNIAKSLFVVGMRYHAVVLGAKSNTPFLSLAYENKMVEVSNYTKMKEYNITLYENKDFNIMGKLESLYKRNDEIRKKLKEVNPGLVNLALIPMKEIDTNEKEFI